MYEDQAASQPSLLFGWCLGMLCVVASITSGSDTAQSGGQQGGVAQREAQPETGGKQGGERRRANAQLHERMGRSGDARQSGSPETVLEAENGTYGGKWCAAAANTAVFCGAVADRGPTRQGKDSGVLGG